MPILTPTIYRGYKGQFGLYLSDGADYDMAGDYSVTPKTFSLFDGATINPVVVKEIEINMVTNGKVLVTGFGAGAALTNGLLYSSSNTNGGSFSAAYTTNLQLFDLTNEITQFDFQTGYTFYKLILSTIGASDPVFDSRNGDDITIVARDNMATRVIYMSWFITGHYV